MHISQAQLNMHYLLSIDLSIVYCINPRLSSPSFFVAESQNEQFKQLNFTIMENLQYYRLQHQHCLNSLFLPMKKNL